MVHVDVLHANIEPRKPNDDPRYSRIVNGFLRVAFIPSGMEIADIPIRFIATVDILAELWGKISVEIIDVAGRQTTNRVHDGRKRLLHLHNEGLLLEVLHAQDPQCAQRLLI